MSVAGWMIYALSVGLFVTPAAWLLDHGLARLGVPTRWVWLGALALSLGLPGVAPLRSVAPSSPTQLTLVATAQPEPATPSVSVVATPQAAGGMATALDLLDRSRAAIDRGLLSGSGLAPAKGSAERWIVGLWTLASALLGLLLVTSMVRLNGRARAGPVRSLLGRQVRVSRDLGPATVGLFAPEIVLPRWATELPVPELELVLKHEEEHARHRDPLLLAIGLLPLLVTPWNPLTWWQLRRLRDAVEVDCDRRVIRSGVARFRYGDLLLKLRTCAVGRDPLVTTMAGPIPLLQRRLTAMRKTRLRTALPGAAASAIVAVALVGVACGTRPPAAEEPAEIGDATSAIEWDTLYVSASSRGFVDVRRRQDGPVQRAALSDLDSLFQQMVAPGSQVFVAMQANRDYGLDQVMSALRAGRAEIVAFRLFDWPGALQLPLPELNRDLAALRAALEEISNGSVRIEALEAIYSARASDELKRVLDDLVQMRSQLRVLRDRYTDDYPVIRALRTNIRLVETESVAQVLEGIISELEAEVTRASG